MTEENPPGTTDEIAQRPEMSPTDETAYTKLLTKIKRGTGTRDQDTVKVTTRHPDPIQAAVNHQKSIEAVRSAANSARTIQPVESEEDNGDQ